MESKRILVTGSNGQLARSLAVVNKSFLHELFLLDRQSLDVSNADHWRERFDDIDPDVVINCAAYTDVEGAEDHPEAAFAINDSAVVLASRLAAEHDKRFIHISTDYVFDGKASRPYTEKDDTAPLNVYGASKLAGEQGILDLKSDAMIFRVSWLYSPFGKNFVKTMNHLFGTHDEVNVVSDQIASPSSALTFGHFLLECALEGGEPGLYHYSEQGEASWFNLASAVNELTGNRAQVHAVDSEYFPTKAERPAYSKLDNRKIEAIFAPQIPHWRESLESCLNYE
ncbi:MAG: dTDP-4-dehydrorhamnose reductase [Flavobacteriales bacterium]|nr:dTDP-4-dehydrorhamnose reductase [Flavobacteriales bacterium]